MSGGPAPERTRIRPWILMRTWAAVLVAVGVLALLLELVLGDRPVYRHLIRINDRVAVRCSAR